MRREAVFSRVTGNDQLSGLSGMLSYRNGQFERFHLIVTFGIAGQFDRASRVSYSAPAALLTIEVANTEDRTSGLLASLGLVPAGANGLFGSDFMPSPIRYLLVQLGGPQACLNITADLVLTAPVIGGWSTGRQRLALCFNPFSFDLTLRTRSVVAVVVGVDNRVRLFYQQGNGGLEASVTAGIYPTVLGHGVFLDGGANLSLGAGVSGPEICGGAEVRAGYTAPASGPAACATQFVPDNVDRPDGPGVCRTSASIGADVRMGTDYRTFSAR